MTDVDNRVKAVNDKIVLPMVVRKYIFLSIIVELSNDSNAYCAYVKTATVVIHQAADEVDKVKRS